MAFEQVMVHCTDKGQDMKADVLHRTDRTLKVVLVGTNISISLKRIDAHKPYVGNVGKLEFTSTGDVV